MNSKEQIVAAVDIGTTKIVTIVGKKTENGKIEILGLSKAPSNGVKRGVVINIDETVRSIQTTVRDVQQRTGISFTEAFVGIAGQHITSMKNRGYIMRDSFDNEIREDEVDRLKNDMYKINIAPGQQIIHVIPQSFIVDEETGISNPVGMCGKRLEANFHIVIGQIASAQNIGRCMGKASLKVKSLMLEPLASAEAVLTDDEREAGVVLVDIGGGTTDVAIYYDNVIRHTAVIPLGGNAVTSDIKEGCAILQRQAEQLKTQYGSAFGDIAPDDKVVSIPGIGNRDPKEISFKNLAYIIQSRMEEIIECVNFEIQNSGYADKLAAGVVVTGGGAMLKHLPQLMKFKTAMDVRIGLPNEHLSGSGRTEINQPMYATAVGLIMCGIDHLESTGGSIATNTINNEKIGERREKPVEEEIEMEEVEKEPKREKKNIIDLFRDKLVDLFDADEGPSIAGEN
jgi:cell division protein FtsA